jgi:hypothetical protein
MASISKKHTVVVVLVAAAVALLLGLSSPLCSGRSAMPECHGGHQYQTETWMITPMLRFGMAFGR